MLIQYDEENILPALIQVVAASVHMMSDVLSLTTAVSMNTITWLRRWGIVMLKVKGNLCLGEKQALHCIIPSGKHVPAMNTPVNPTFI